MPRSARVVVPGFPHHVTERGNNRQPIFFVDDDRRTFLGLLRSAAVQYRLHVEAYCLMDNHVHLVVVPDNADALALSLKQTNQLYAQYVNRMQDRTGHLWEDRFFSCCLDDMHYWTAMTYVERNPVRAGMAAEAWLYPWSSAAAHCGGPDRTGLLHLNEWMRKVPNSDWREALARTEDEKALGEIRRATHRNRPLGSDSFISKLEHAVGRRLRPLPSGRPAKRKLGTDPTFREPNGDCCSPEIAQRTVISLDMRTESGVRP